MVLKRTMICVGSSLLCFTCPAFCSSQRWYHLTTSLLGQPCKTVNHQYHICHVAEMPGQRCLWSASSLPQQEIIKLCLYNSEVLSPESEIVQEHSVIVMTVMGQVMREMMADLGTR